MTLRVAVPIEQFWHRVPGGTGRATAETLAALVTPDTDCGHDPIEVVPLAAAHRRQPPGGRPVPTGLGPVAHLPLPRPALYESWIRWDRPRIERWTGPVDLTWAVSMIPVPSRAPMVATVHDLAFLDQPGTTSRRGRSFFPRALAAVADRAALIVCPSQIVADDCVRHGIAADRILVVPWGVDPPRCGAEGADAVRSALGLPERFVLWVGTIEPRKNLTRLVDAMTRLDGPPLVVVGPGGWNLDGDDVLAPLGDRAIRLGTIDDVQLSAVYRTASAFVLPSLAEGFGLPVLEAMAHGTPVVTSAGTATEEVAGGAAALVDPLNVDSIAHAIEVALSGDPTTLHRIDRGRQRAADLTWSATARGYASAFRDVAGGS